MDSIVECLIKFRGAVRNKILEQDVKDETLLTACDKVRSELSTYGIIIKVQHCIYIYIYFSNLIFKLCILYSSSIFLGSQN